LIDLNDGNMPFIISYQGMVREARIHGDLVVWIEFFMGTPRVMLKDVGTPSAPQLISDASTQPARSLQIGDTFVVWEVDYDIVAYDLRTGGYIWVADTALRERFPSTSGSWVTWEEQVDGSTSNIRAINLDSGEPAIFVADDGGVNSAPTIDGDFIAYEALVDDGAGGLDFDIFLYKISTGQTYPLATGPGDQKLNNVFGDQIAYVDNGSGVNNDIAATTFWLDPPLADAGEDETVHVGMIVTLDGSGSADPDGGPLNYAWEILDLPTGSTATLSNANSVNPSFVPDKLGDYRIGLTVTDEDGLMDEDDVIISTINSAPVADAGPDQAVVIINTQVQLDGSQSWDPDGDYITYNWSMTAPMGSTAILSDPTAIYPTFVADVYGEYVVTLMVSDSWASSMDYVTVSFDNIAPLADAGQNQAASVGELVLLDGSASYDANNDSLTYNWGFVSKPPYSLAQIFPLDDVKPSFGADVAGTYVVSLVVNDGLLDSEPDTVTIVVTQAVVDVVEVLESAIEIIYDLNPDDFKNRNMPNALTNKLNATLEKVDQGLYQEALSKLEHDILSKMNGCADSGAPDKNDWIINCPAQNQIYPIIMEAIELLRDML
jgi:hypothetical protein